MANTVKTNTRKTVKAAAVKAAPVVPMLPIIEQAPAKIERPRAEVKNGIKAPLRAGKCKHVWEVCQAMYEANPAMQGANVTNTQIEFYRWRKFTFGGAK